MSETTRPMIHPAIIKIMRAVEPISKDQRNQQQNYNFRGIDQVYNSVHPHFAEHGVYSTSTILESEHRTAKSEKGKDYIHAILKVRFTFWAEDGSSVPSEVVAEGIDYGGDKASNKALSTAHKYAILQILNIPTAAIDNDQGRQKQGNVYAEWVRTAATSLADTDDEERIAKLWSAITGHKPQPTDGERAYLKECKDAAMVRAQAGVPA